MPVFDEQRQAVWIALSDLFLDTDVAIFYDNIVKNCAESPYNLHELEAILNHEVAPVCYSNLLDIAGDWAGFDEQWLVQTIMQYLEEKPSLLQKPKSYLWQSYVKQHWKNLAPAIQQYRDQAKH